jgi:hypothetical protein
VAEQVQVQVAAVVVASQQAESGLTSFTQEAHLVNWELIGSQFCF